MKESVEGKEKRAKSGMERLTAGILRVIGFCSFVLFLISGALGVNAVIKQDDDVSFSLMLSALCLFAWFVCRTARYILDDVISQRQKEKPNAVGRIGQVLHWAGFIGAIVFLFVGAIELFEGSITDSPAPVLISWGYGIGLYLTGAAARYILKGD